MRIRKKAALGFAALGTVLLASTAFAQDYTAEEEKEFAVGRGGRLELTNISGDVKITTWDRDAIHVKAIKRARGRSAELKASMTRVLMDSRGDRVTVEVRYPKNEERRERGFERDFNVSVEFDVRIPRGIEGEIKVVSGNLQVAGFAGEVDLTVISGNLTAADLAGDIEIDCTSGSVRLNRASGELDVNITSGDLIAREIGGAIDIDVTSGNIDVFTVGLEEMDANVMSGNIDLAFSAPVTKGKFDLSAFSGSITVSLPAGSAFSVDATSHFSGSVRSDFELKERSTRMGESAYGEINGGGAKIKAKTKTGNINLEQR